MNRGTQRPLTLVSAPAGFGKTVLEVSWETLCADPGSVTHITMDAFNELHVGFLGSALEARQAAVDEESALLVLDCGDFTVSPELGISLDRLIRDGAGRLRVVLLTRTDPPLPLHRYRLEGALAEIRAADLAFTPEETTALMQRQKLDLTSAEVAELQARTDGWPAGLMFAAIALAGKTDMKRAIREFRGDAGNVAAYLMTEVLDAQPSELREFLLRTCVVDELQPALVEALTGRACDLRSLEFLSHGNSFIQQVPGIDGRYSYQSLFRQFLRTQLSFEEPALVPVLHRAAAGWFAGNGQGLAAIRHAVSAQRWGDAAKYLVDDLDFGHLLAGGQRQLLELLFAGMPDDLDGAEVAVVRAARALGEFDVALCTSELSKARTSLEHDAPRRAQACELAITVLQAVSASIGTDIDTGLDATLVAEGALRAALPGSVTAHPELRMLVAGCKGRVLLQRGDFGAALVALDDGITVAETAGGEEALADLLGMAALVEAAWGHLRRSAEIAAHVAALTESGGTHLSEPRSAIVAQAWVCADQGDLTAARELAHRAEEAAPTYDARVLAAALTLVRARLLRAGGDIDLAGAELRAARRSYGTRLAGWLGQSLVVDQAKLLVAQHLPREAIGVIEKSAGREQVGSLLALQRAAIEVGEHAPASPPPLPVQPGTVPLDDQVDGWLVQAARSIKNGDSGRSRRCLERALRLAAPECLRRPFFEAPSAVSGLLQPSGDLMARHSWLRTPGSAGAADHAGGGPSAQSPAAPGGGATRTRATPMTNSLTSKEQEVLVHLAELLTTDEIAKTMFVSVNTVRSHVRSILRKLSASRRNEAVRRAWELGLLPTRPAALPVSPDSGLPGGSRAAPAHQGHS